MIASDGRKSTVKLKGCDLIILKGVLLCFDMHAMNLFWFSKNGDEHID